MQLSTHTRNPAKQVEFLRFCVLNSTRLFRSSHASKCDFFFVIVEFFELFVSFFKSYVKTAFSSQMRYRFRFCSVCVYACVCKYVCMCECVSLSTPTVARRVYNPQCPNIPFTCVNCCSGTILIKVHRLCLALLSVVPISSSLQILLNISPTLT